MQENYAGVAELANALDLGSSGALLAGSSPVARTKRKSTLVVLFLLVWVMWCEPAANLPMQLHFSVRHLSLGKLGKLKRQLQLWF